MQNEMPFLWLLWVKIPLATTCNSTIIEMCDDMIQVSQGFKLKFLGQLSPKTYLIY